MGSRTDGTNLRAMGTNPRALALKRAEIGLVDVTRPRQLPATAQGGVGLATVTSLIERCGAPTRKGGPCRWQRAECPVLTHGAYQSARTLREMDKRPVKSDSELPIRPGVPMPSLSGGFNSKGRPRQAFIA